MIVTTQTGPGATTSPHELDEALSTRLRDLALVDLDALTSNVGSPAALLDAFADDVADALGQARARIAALRGSLGGPEPLNVLDLTPRQRASDAGAAGAERVRTRLATNAAAARTLARVSELAATLVPKLFEVERRRAS